MRARVSPCKGAFFRCVGYAAGLDKCAAETPGSTSTRTGVWFRQLGNGDICGPTIGTGPDPSRQLDKFSLV